MALAAGASFEGRRAGWTVGGVVVDHGLHEYSAAVAAEVAQRLTTLETFTGMDPVDVVRVAVGSSGGPEGSARKARRKALSAAAERYDAVVLLGHTRDDQAETVLLGLARGSGLRSLGGMRSVSGIFRRPLLGVSRAATVQTCLALGIPVWSDPDNDDPRFSRVRVRRTVLPVLEDQLGPGITEALARTADLASADADALDALAAELAVNAGLDYDPAGQESHLDISVLAGAPAALRRRVLRLAALAAGSPGGELFAVHLQALDALVADWHGQGGVDLPGHVTAARRGTSLTLTRYPPA
jgi:tRNA(Ile)-lysidine synthase